MGSLLELQEMLMERDDRIKQLEAVVRVRDNEIMELKSQLDKFQSVIPYATVAAGVSKVRARKTRAQGISAEPQSLKTAQELMKLSQTTFPVISKDLRYASLEEA
ncbi:cGMP-dependent protein kinase 1-like isoform X2 [Scylla paramamosain]|uniref:cGMP-dependent protein kinase 1-like isoform X2 n=1 Tax=Scylla paramamosain TaxID=85552 RepID=UPI003082FF5D